MRFLPLLFFSSLAFADIEYQTTIVTVQPFDHELVGSIFLTFNDNDLSGVSPTNPAYLRLELKESTLISGTNAEGSDPIYLAARARFLNPSPTSLINIPTDSITLIRSKDGEKGLWIRFTAGTDEWLSVDGVLQPPSEDQKVDIYIGISGSESYDHFRDDFAMGRANLEANMRNGAPADTQLHVNLTTTTLEAGERLEVYARLWDATTTGVETEEFETNIVFGNQIGIYSGENPEIARLDPRYAVPTLGEWGSIFFTSALCLTALIMGRRRKLMEVRTG